MKSDYVILVDEADNEIGVEEKLKAHLKGDLHRAISVFIFNSENKMLLQKRAETKYHSGGLWTNTCCSHPMVGENTGNAAKRRLREEMGIDCDSLKFIFHFIYKAQLDNNLIEHELDHVFIAKSDVKPLPDPDEVSDWKYASFEEIEQDLKLNPNNYSHWFKLILKRVKTLAQENHLI